MSQADEVEFTTPAPFLGHCGIRRLSVGNGEARNEVFVEPHLGNRSGAAHGGLLMTMLDSVLASAGRSVLPDDHGMMTIDMQAAFLSPGRGRLTGTGRVVRRGGSLIFCEGEIRDEKGDLVAKATGMFRPRRPAAEKTGSGTPPFVRITPDHDRNQED